MKHQFRLFIVTLIFIGAAIYLLKDGDIYKSNQLYSGLIGNILATFFAAFLVWVAWEQWSKLSKTSSADFVHKLTEDFFTPETRTLISLIECRALIYIESFTISDDEITSDGITKSQDYFKVDCDILKKSHLPDEIINDLTKKKFYSPWEIDDLLLSPLEDVGMLEDCGIINFQMVYSGFSYYLATVLDYREIKKYINNMRNDVNIGSNKAQSFIYGNAQYIAKKCQEYDDLHSGICKWLWLIKRQFCHMPPVIEFKLSEV